MSNPALQILRSIPRRRCLQAMLAGCAGWQPAWCGLRSAAANGTTLSSRRPIRSCIVIFHYGGPSQLEMFDPKPDAPAEVRGEYKTIGTAVPGTQISEHWRLTAQVMDRIALVRSAHHPMRNHNSAAAEVLTGRTPAGGDLELLADEARSFPTLGSAVAYGLGPRANLLPYTMYNVVQLPGQTPGILGGMYDRFQVQGNPNADNFRVSALDLPSERSPDALSGRESLLRTLDTHPMPSSTESMRDFQERALELIASDDVRWSFDVSQEPPASRERYGRHLLGQSTLLARRLVESGVNVVAVFDGERNGQTANWDSHENLFPRHLQLIPPADQSFSALILDLEERGLLESTLIVSLAEFGRTPRINGNAGRDHWPDCFTVAFAGGGVRGGAVYGSSDRMAAYPECDPCTPADVVATILWRFGINPQTEMYDPTNRPFRLSEGQPLVELFG
jgi:Protein of unknown function (DUF1501)